MEFARIMPNPFRPTCPKFHSKKSARQKYSRKSKRRRSFLRAFNPFSKGRFKNKRFEYIPQGGKIVNFGILCPECGLMQLNRPTCKSCGAKLIDSSPNFSLPEPQPKCPESADPLLSGSTGSVPPDFPKKDAPHHRLSFHGRGGVLFGIWIVNIFLSLVTLGVYYFWGKVKVRRFLFGQTEFDGDRFEYHGTGKELLMGFLKALLFFFIPLFLLNSVPHLLKTGPVIRAITTGIAYAVIMIFVPIAMVGARRYRLSRTSWRGIRFSFRGEKWDFLKIFAFGSFLSTITLGLYFPFFDARRYEFMISQTHFGNRKFSFDGRGKDLFRPFLFAILLTLPTLGFFWFWYWAKRQRYYWEHTFIGPARFRSSVTGRVLMNLYVGNFLISLISLGLGWPWTVTRKAQYACKYLTLEGSLDLAEIHQDAKQATATGEVLSGFLDADFSLG
jgi:uncharacterized membrane protein YjgN (DUF898 family)